MRSTQPSKLPFMLMLLAAAAIAVATVLEDARGTSYAYLIVYGSLWFKALWGAIAVSGLYAILHKRMWHRPALLLLHLSFVVILMGALTTSVTGFKGTLHLRKGIPENRIVCGTEIRKLPYLVRLDDFYINYYPGTDAPQDYVSQISIDRQPSTISMNRIASHKGYRFYQSSYDDDHEGSILTVAYDPWGTPLTYLGYALLALSTVGVLFGKKRDKVATLLALLAFCSQAQAESPKAMSAAKVHDTERMQVMWNNRPTAFGVMAHEFMLKVYGKDNYQELSSTQVVASMMMEPARWSHEPIIKVKRGDYRSLVSYVNPKDGSLQGLGKDPKEDEKVALMAMLMQGPLFSPLPEDMEPLSPIRIEAELLYHKINWTLWLMILFAITTVTSIAQKKASLPMGKHGDTISASIRKASLFAGKCGFAFLLLLWLWRWYLAGHIPFGGGFDTLIFVSICLMGAAAVRPRLLTVSAGCSTLLLLVAHMGAMNPQITPLMPVLHSPWLSAHVSIIMLSYALLVLSIVERKLLRYAVCALAIGIFLGAVWANVSWGTYWSWDPKESWALITLLVYSIPLHTESLPWFRSTRNYRLYSVLALACLLMTYFGVNFLLGGMHSYGA